MNVDWPHPICIVCLEGTDLTVEHLIPRSLGGILTSNLICKACNDRFGHGFESKARLAPELRRAATEVVPLLKELSASLEVGARYSAEFDGQRTTRRVDRNLRLGFATLPDGSMIVPELQTAEKLREMLGKERLSADEVSAALALWKDGPSDLSPDIRAVANWNSPPLND